MDEEEKLENKSLYRRVLYNDMICLKKFRDKAFLFFWIPFWYGVLAPSTAWGGVGGGVVIWLVSNVLGSVG